MVAIANIGQLSLGKIATMRSNSEELPVPDRGGSHRLSIDYRMLAHCAISSPRCCAK